MKSVQVGVSVFALIIASGVASAQLAIPASQVSGIHVDDALPEIDRAVGTVYDSIPGPYAAFPVAGGNLGFDDYDSTITGPTMLLAQFRFVGGVTNAGESVRVNFFDSALNLVNFFTVALPVGGSTSIWTITLGPGADGIDSTFSVPSEGVVQILTEGAATGRFWLTTTAPSIGSNNLSFGSSDTHYHAFALRAVPAPAGVALLGLAGLAAARRRRN